MKRVYVNMHDGLVGISNARGDIYNERYSWRYVTSKEELECIEKSQVVIYGVQLKDGRIREVTRKTALKYL